MRSTIPFDPFNPGQVFACLGLAEAAQTLHARVGETRAAFDFGDVDQGRFHLEVAGDRAPLQAIFGFLAEANVVALGVDGHQTTKWSIETEAVEPGDAFPNAPPSSPAALPVELRRGTESLRFAHWGDTTTRDAVKFWAGAAGYPGAALLRDALDLVREALPHALEDPFSVSAVQSSSFRFDWRRDYVPIDTGFSLNRHGKIKTVGYPLVEIFAALGLSHARPLRLAKLRYAYGCLVDPDHRLLPLPLLRAGLGGHAISPFVVRRFRMELAHPGKDDRCITHVYEEAST